MVSFVDWSWLGLVEPGFGPYKIFRDCLSGQTDYTGLADWGLQILLLGQRHLLAGQMSQEFGLFIYYWMVRLLDRSRDFRLADFFLKMF